MEEKEIKEKCIEIYDNKIEAPYQFEELKKRLKERPEVTEEKRKRSKLFYFIPGYMTFFVVCVFSFFKASTFHKNRLVYGYIRDKYFSYLGLGIITGISAIALFIIWLKEYKKDRKN